MFCEECGSPLKEGDKLCQVCGVEVAGAVEAADSIQDHQNSGEPQTEEIYGQSTVSGEERDASDGVALQTEPDDSDMLSEPQTEEGDSGIKWDLNGFPTPRKTEEINFNWNIEDFNTSEKETSMFVNAANISEEPVAFSDFTEELNKYFTFEKTNEDFQKVLDQDYDKIKDYSHPTENHSYIQRMSLADRAGLVTESSDRPRTRRRSASAAALGAGVLGTGLVSEAELPTQGESEPASEAELPTRAESELAAEAQIQTEIEAEPASEPDLHSVIWSESATEAEFQTEIEPESAPEPEPETETESIPEFALQKEIDLEPAGTAEPEPETEIGTEPDPDGISEFEDQDETEIILDSQRVIEEPADTEGKEERETEPAEEAAEEFINEADDEDEEEPEVIWVGGITDGQKESGTETEIPENHPIDAEDMPIEDLSTPTTELPTEELTATELPASPSEEDGPEEDTEKSAGLWFEAGGEEVEVKKGGRVGRAILIVIIAVLVAEAALLGIQYFFPGSGAAKKAGEINAAVSGTLVEWKDRTVDFFKGIGGKETGSGDLEEQPEGIDPETGLPLDGGVDPESETEEPNPVPAANKESLIEAAKSFNKNIAEVRANDSLAWQEGRNYIAADITNSRPIENNHWTTRPSGEHVYYDEEIVAVLMNFDSKWIDYVNGGSDAVINLTKEGSPARRNAETFSKVGRVEQTFLLVEIGEIRQGAEGFYAWTYEEIQEVENNRTIIKEYNWIYQLEPVDGEMKIVNYYSY